jgi:hypothetical protein
MSPRLWYTRNFQSQAMNTIQLGLKENWKQFSILVMINAFVGGMIGLERSVLPQLAEKDFGILPKQQSFHLSLPLGLRRFGNLKICKCILIHNQ